MKNIRKNLFCTILTLMISLLMIPSAFAADTSAFVDVAPQSPWYEGVQFVQSAGITNGTGNRCYSPDTLINVQQLSIMLCRALNDESLKGTTMSELSDSSIRAGMRAGWLNETAILDPTSAVSRGNLYRAAFGAFGIDTYSYELYDGGKQLPETENCLRIGKEFGLCTSVAKSTDLVTRGEVADAIYRIMTTDFIVDEPPILQETPIINEDAVALNGYLLEIQRVPESVRDLYRDYGWTYIIDSDAVAKHSEAMGQEYAGLTNYAKKCIIVTAPQYTMHEYGHFLHHTLKFPAEIDELYRKEMNAAESVLGNYSTTNSHEFFAEFFEYWHDNRNNSRKMEALQTNAPETYELFNTLEANNWLSIAPQPTKPVS